MNSGRVIMRSFPAWEPLPPRAVTVTFGLCENQPVALWPLEAAVLLGTTSENPRLQRPDTGQLLLPVTFQGDPEHWRLMDEAREKQVRVFFDAGTLRSLKTRRHATDQEIRWPDRCLPMTPEGALLLLADTILEPRAKIEQRQLTGLLSVINGMLNLDDHTWLDRQRRRMATHIEVTAGSPQALALESTPRADPLFPRLHALKLRPVIMRSYLEIADTVVAMLIRGLKHAPTPIPDLLAMAKAVRWPGREDLARNAARLVRQCELSPDILPPPERRLDALPEGAPAPGIHSGLMREYTPGP